MLFYLSGGFIYLVKDENKEMKFYPIKLEEL